MENMSPESIILMIWIFCALLGGAIGHVKNRLALGVIMGGLLGIIGVIVIACLPKQEASPASNAASNTASSLDELDKLASLKDKGIITEEEYEKKKKRILET